MHAVDKWPARVTLSHIPCAHVVCCQIGNGPRGHLKMSPESADVNKTSEDAMTPFGKHSLATEEPHLANIGDCILHVAHPR